MPRILIVEDDLSFTALLEDFLKRHQFEVSVAPTIKSGISLLQDELFDLVLLDYRLPDGTGLDVLRLQWVREQGIPIIIMTSFHDIKTAVKAIKHGAYEFITKPVNPDELLMIVRDALRNIGITSAKTVSAPIVEGTTEESKKILEHIKLVAPTDMSVVITGESGTGKEQAARMIHENSKRKDGPFIAVDCGALSPELAASEIFGHVKGAFTGAANNKKGKLELASGGTLFLDEVGNLDYEVQIKLLRALQEKEIQPVGSNKTIKTNARIIAATNEDLLFAVRNGTFREDLYHRLNEFKIILLSLRQRREDFDLFVNHFIAQANAELGKSIKGLSPEVKKIFEAYRWPGNLRELKNIIKRAVLLTPSEVIEKEALPEEMMLALELPEKNTTDLKAVKEMNERELILKTLQEVRYNKSKAAKLLNIDRTTLYYKMAKYGIEG